MNSLEKCPFCTLEHPRDKEGGFAVAGFYTSDPKIKARQNIYVACALIQDCGKNIAGAYFVKFRFDENANHVLARFKEKEVCVLQTDGLKDNTIMKTQEIYAAIIAKFQEIVAAKWK